MVLAAALKREPQEIQGARAHAVSTQGKTDRGYLPPAPGFSIDLAPR